MQPGRGWRPESCRDYRILTVLSGSLDVAGVPYGSGQAVLLPRLWQGLLAATQGAPPRGM